MVDFYRVAANAYISNPNILNSLTVGKCTSVDAKFVVDMIAMLPESEWTGLLRLKFRQWGSRRVVCVLKCFPIIHRLIILWRISLRGKERIPISLFSGIYARRILADCLLNTVRGLPCGFDTLPVDACTRIIGADASWVVRLQVSDTMLPPSTCASVVMAYHTPTVQSQKLHLPIGTCIRPRGRIFASTNPLWQWTHFVNNQDPVRYDIVCPAYFPVKVMCRYEDEENLPLFGKHTNKTLIIEDIVSYTVIDTGIERGYRFYRLQPCVQFQA